MLNHHYRLFLGIYLLYQIPFQVIYYLSTKHLGYIMTQEVASLDKSPNFCSVIKVDKDIAFVLDNRDLNFSVPVPTDKSIGMSRKTYSKKHPVTYNSDISCSEDNVLNSGTTPKYKKSSVKNSPKCSSNSKVTKQTRKRPLNSTGTPPLKRLRKKEASSTKVPHTKVNGRVSCRNKCHRSSLSVQPSSPDSDIEIIEVIESNSSKAVKRDLHDSFSGRERNKDRLSDIPKKKNSKSLPTILKPCYPSNDDVPITEADIAPVIPSNSVIPDTSISETNQDVNAQSPKKWLLSNGTSENSSIQNGEICRAKQSDNKFTDKCSLNESDVKISPDRRYVGGRELKSLYENLNEISWSKEKNFQQMINNADNRHSERITAKVTDVGKSLRRLKAGTGNKLPLSSNKQNKSSPNKNSAKLVLNRAKYGRLKPKLVIKKGKNWKAPLKNKKVLTKPVKPNKNLKAGAKNVQSKVSSKLKAVSGFKQKSQLSASHNHLKAAGNALKSKTGNNSRSAGKSGLPSALKKSVLKTENGGDMFTKSSTDNKVVKKLEKMEFAKEVEILNKSFGDNKIFTTAVKKGSKLRVRVEPLEHTNLWNTDFCEAFSKFVLEQSSSQMGTKSQDSIKAMFEELMESWFHPPDDGKFPKKKKPEEETLRSSVRQSEGAFRYKEIVVKKHENYMQFILVPNAVKQNSLSIEAMKELKEAFLLAKKDPNCRAVLLNSSGTFFCSGIDLSLLIGNNKKQAAEEMALTIKELVLTLSTFTKPVVAAVNGTTVGFGVSLLTFCDVVLASDKATFCIPATSLGYMPEGAITLTLPQVVGSAVASELLLYGRRLTADQALRHGLVSEVLWHSNLMNEVVPRVQIIVSQPLQVMEATKSMVRCQLWDRLKFHMEREWRLLPSLWLDAQCQNNIKRALQTGWLID